jgi:4-amino-4-deoxy-L-arabinose transferase-like glycosyltransferase
VSGRGSAWAWMAAVMGLALCVRVAAFAAASSANPSAVMTPDSYGYDRLARTLLHHGRFADGPESPPQTRRTPGYPLLVAAVYAGAGEDPRRAVWLGIALSVLTVGLTMRIAQRLWGPGPAAAAGLLLALDLPSVTAARHLLTETPFAALVVAATAAAVSLVLRDRPSAGWAFLLGVLLASAALTRPIGLLLVLPASLWLLHSGRALRWGGRATAAIVAAFVLPWIVLVGGWQVRNRVVAGALRASDGPAKFLLLSRGGDVVAQRDGIPVERAREELARKIAEASRQTGVPEDRLYLRAALDLVIRHPGLFLATQLRWLPELLLGTGAASLPTLGLVAGDGPGERGAVRILSSAAVVHLLIVYVGAGLCLWSVRRESVPRRLAVLWMLGLATYFVILSTGPQAYSRFRVPFVPLLAICAGGGLCRRWDDRQRTAERSPAAAA